MRNIFFRVSSASNRVCVADVSANVDNILSTLKMAVEEKPDVVVFPELSLTAYTCADLFHNRALLDSASVGLKHLLENYPAEIPLVVVGMPVEYDGALYNCSVAISDRKVVGIVPKSYLPAYNEFYETRWFHSGAKFDSPVQVTICEGIEAPMSHNLLFDVDSVRIGCEICEDLWAPIPPSSMLAQAGADIILNLSASDDIVGKYTYLRSLVAQQSARCICAYAYTSAGHGESSTDLVFDGKGLICENGHILAEADRFKRGNKYIVADIDINSLRRERMHTNTFANCADRWQVKPPCTVIEVNRKADRQYSPETILRPVPPHPFIPEDSAHRFERCDEILHIQVSGLSKRLEATHTDKLVIGVSGGLDSTLALLVAIRAFDSLGLDRKGIHAITMPGFGTTERTHSNALRLMQLLGVTCMEIPIGEAVKLHFKDIGQDPEVKDITYENSQARERTQILMDYANKIGGMVLGTGDLSELALGWATYNGDHMSMYGVNAGVPKTLVRHLVERVAESTAVGEGREQLLDICDTPISPELIPANDKGEIVQKTEDVVGPYELHDFFLYHFLRHGRRPSAIYLLACKAFAEVYDAQTILKWLKTFFRRFFSQQFKRSCMPDGPKVGSVSLSPRGDWRMPSDASAAVWLAEITELEEVVAKKKK